LAKLQWRGVAGRLHKHFNPSEWWQHTCAVGKAAPIILACGRCLQGHNYLDAAVSTTGTALTLAAVALAVITLAAVTVSLSRQQGEVK
jgi:hypothetical protein